MGDVKRVDEVILLEEEEMGERRVVSLVAGEGLVLLERSSGPVTEVAYGARRHGHKILCGNEQLAHAFGIAPEQVGDVLARLFGGEEPAQLSDVMDVLDREGCTYTYVAWTGEGDVAFRSEDAW